MISMVNLLGQMLVHNWGILPVINMIKQQNNGQIEFLGRLNMLKVKGRVVQNKYKFILKELEEVQSI